MQLVTFLKRKKKRKEERGKKKYFMFTPGIQKEESVEMDIPPFEKGNSLENRNPRDFLLNRKNFDNLMKTLGDQIGKNFEGRKGLMESKLANAIQYQFEEPGLDQLSYQRLKSGKKPKHTFLQRKHQFSSAQFSHSVLSDSL